MGQQQHTMPVYVDQLGAGGNGQLLTPVPFQRDKNEEGGHDERGRQDLIFRFQQTLPAGTAPRIKQQSHV
ncbi:MAG: hypothetical protein U1F14_09315 [Steroidobacteraceae bacterium]